MSTPTTLTSRQVRSEFWKVHPQFRRGMMRQNGNWRQKTHNEHNATTRTAFVEFVDGLAREGRITEQVASNVTL